MNPTHELRFVERMVTDGLTQDGLLNYKRIRVLQQKWAGAIQVNGVISATYEWRDVPLVKEHR
jgi:hypothetical protein